MDEEGETHAHSIDINDSIKTKLSVRRSNPSLVVPISCIYRVHKRICKMNEDAYTPDIVSIGRYHRGMENLQAMEELKLQYLQTLLDRTRERTSLEEYVEALKKLEDEARGCYSEPIKLSSNEFIEMMLFDSFFIIELFWKNFNSQYFRIDDNDLIFYSKSRSGIIMRDLVLLENQIPMSILEKLFNLSMDPKHDSLPLIKMALYFFSGLIPQAMHKYPQKKDNIEVVVHNHLLDLLAYTLDSSLRVVKMPDLRKTVESLPCVTELLCPGVKFKKSPKYNGSLIDIKYNEGVIEIPQLCVHDFTESFFRNLMAYEQYRFGGTPYITSYATLMDYLINSVDDLAFLRDSGIIVNQLGDDNKVFSLFSNLCNEISSTDFYYNELCDKVNEYYKRRIHRWKATLKRDYCDNPWKIISVVTAILLLFLTAWGTIFTTLPFFNVHA